MAADNEKTVVQTTEGEPAPSGGGKKKKLILFGGIGVGIIVIGVLLALFVLKPMLGSSKSEETASEPKAKESKVEKAEKPAEKKEEKKKEEKKGESSGGLVYAIKDIVVNPAGTGGSRFLSVSFGFDLASQEAMAQIEEREPLVRDALITILSSKTLAELTDAKQKEVMRMQIKKRVAQLVGADELLGVYYTDFVLQ
jgi:flagellar protein FliL